MNRLQESFESWALGEGLSTHQYEGKYLFHPTREAWKGWQAHSYSTGRSIDVLSASVRDKPDAQKFVKALELLKGVLT